MIVFDVVCVADSLTTLSRRFRGPAERSGGGLPGGRVAAGRRGTCPPVPRKVMTAPKVSTSQLESLYHKEGGNAVKVFF